MAKFCEQCGKRNNIFMGEPYYINDDKFLCCKCSEYIINDINRLFYAKTEDEYKTIANKIATTCKEHYNETITPYVLAKIDNIREQLEFTETIDESSGINSNIGPFENQDLVYTIDGVRGRHIDIYVDKVVITTRVTLGSIITHNATDGEKTIYYSDCVGVQFKQSKLTIGYLQLETASSSGNNKKSNFFDENSFTFDTTVISNERMEEVANYIKNRMDAVKNGTTTPVPSNINNVSVADELLKFKQLLDMGVITQEEFERQKDKLLQ